MLLKYIFLKFTKYFRKKNNDDNYLSKAMIRYDKNGEE